MINNIKLITPLLNFENSGDFYMLYVLKRKKDQPEREKNNHQSVRTIKSYCIESIEYLNENYEEIQMLCEFFKARAYIYVQKKDHKSAHDEMMIELTKKNKNKQYNQRHLFDSIVGKLHGHEKRWIVDVDDIKEASPLMMAFIEYECKPITVVKFDDAGVPNGYEVGPKIEAIIPTRNGHHLITKKFDVLTFSQKYPGITIQKENPTLLYYPNSLD